MADAYPKCDVWACDRCKAAVFIPRSVECEGGVCTQQARGCTGELVLLSETAASIVRAMLARSGRREQPWLTLVFALPAGEDEVPRG